MRWSHACAVVCYLAFIAAVYVWEPDDPVASVLIIGSTVLVGAMVGRWLVIPVGAVAVATVIVAVDHATGCTGIDGCETALVIFVLTPIYAALLCVGVLAGYVIRRARPRVDGK
jgi:uncharacterized membrane protein AbrB (regulator of aidB expression)